MSRSKELGARQMKCTIWDVLTKPGFTGWHILKSLLCFDAEVHPFCWPGSGHPTAGLTEAQFEIPAVSI